jgi:hypothetical protein
LKDIKEYAKGYFKELWMKGKKGPIPMASYVR